MNESQDKLKHRDLTERVIGIFYDVYNELGCGFLESVYGNAMLLALRQAGLAAEAHVPAPVWFRGALVGDFRADIVVERKLLLELKAARCIEPVFEAQLLNYLRATPLEIGLLLNFGPKPEFKRMVFDNDRKQTPAEADARSEDAIRTSPPPDSLHSIESASILANPRQLS